MRTERDALGEVVIPDGALWGAQTQRAVENFRISGWHWERDFIAALGHVKWACLKANAALGRVPQDLVPALEQACAEVIAGMWDAQFPVDVFQTGSGTSTNMNVNEVLANRAAQLLGLEPGRKAVHPNDHVNASQSSNDVFPTAIHVAVTLALRDTLIPALAALQAALAEKAHAFDGIVKTGRTHLQDATPIRLGQEFSGYAAQVACGIERVQRALAALEEVPLGGTAVGTGVNAPAGFAELALEHLNAALGTRFRRARNPFEANAARDALVEVSGLLKTVAVSLSKVANDVRWLGSGPRNGLGELRLPAVQPGSSIMPGKVNPVMAEALLMVCAQVIGYDAAVTLGGLGSVFELNMMQPLLAYNLLTSIRLLSNAVRALTERCVVGLEADAEVCQQSLERNLALATALVPYIGYDRAAAISQEAQRSGRTVREVALEQGVLPPETLARVLDAYRLTEEG